MGMISVTSQAVCVMPGSRQRVESMNFEDAGWDNAPAGIGACPLAAAGGCTLLALADPSSN